MKLTISYMSANRLAGKAVRRIQKDFAGFIERVEDIEAGKERYQEVVVWLSDNEIDHYQEVASHGLVSIYVGFDPQLSFKRSDDKALKAFILNRIEFFNDKSGLRNKELGQVLLEEARNI